MPWNRHVRPRTPRRRHCCWSESIVCCKSVSLCNRICSSPPIAPPPQQVARSRSSTLCSLRRSVLILGLIGVTEQQRDARARARRRLRSAASKPTPTHASERTGQWELWLFGVNSSAAPVPPLSIPHAAAVPPITTSNSPPAASSSPSASPPPSSSFGSLLSMLAASPLPPHLSQCVVAPAAPPAPILIRISSTDNKPTLPASLPPHVLPVHSKPVPHDMLSPHSSQPPTPSAVLNAPLLSLSAPPGTTHPSTPILTPTPSFALTPIPHTLTPPSPAASTPASPADAAPAMSAAPPIALKVGPAPVDVKPAPDFDTLAFVLRELKGMRCANTFA
jgi:hypothetical protein